MNGTRKVILPILLLAASVFGGQPSGEPFGSRAAVFEKGGKRLLYREIQPDGVDVSRRYPLVLFLHGAGERGCDNRRQLVHGVKSLVSFSKTYSEPCFYLIPQCPEGRQWVTVPWGSKAHAIPESPSEELALALDLVREKVAQWPVDKGRIYITGISMGGYGTWDAIAREPGLFAAAIPICGGGDVACAERLKGLPIWAFHGSADGAVPVCRSRTMVEALRRAGGRVRYHEYPGAGHDVWTRTYANDVVLRWLFDQRKSDR